jgi:Flp pilus assembly protein TadG
MPDYNQIDYSQIGTIATNLEYLTQEIYNTMSQAVAYNPNREYAYRLTNVLSQLVNASANYTSSVYNNSYYRNSIRDLFYLESILDVTESTLDGYSKAYLVDDQVRALRFYVNQLLWIYRQNN